MSAWVFEASESDFKETVIERSNETPVIVDFWAPWCAPCRALGPMLERLVEEQGGDVVLAKVNIDENASLASAFRVQSIPFLAGFREGTIVAEVVGALPEGELRQFVERVLPSPAERMAAEAEALLANGAAQEAEVLLRKALEIAPRCERATLGLATVLAGRKEDAESLELLERISPGRYRPEADRLAATLRVRGTSSRDEQALLARINAAPDDVEARFELGQVLAAASRYEEALDQYLNVIRRDKEFQDGAARKAMLDVFELVGSESPVTERYRAELAKVLFS